MTATSRVWALITAAIAAAVLIGLLLWSASSPPQPPELPPTERPSEAAVEPPAESPGEVVSPSEPPIDANVPQPIERTQGALPGVRVRVLAAGGQQPLTSTKVWALATDGAAVASALTDADGAAVLSCDADTVELIAQHPDHAPSSSAWLTPAERPEVTMQLQPGERIVGEIVDAADRPVEGARVQMRQTKAKYDAPLRTGVVEATTDAGGEFALRGCGPGTYRISVWHDDHLPWTEEREVGPGLAPIVLRTADVALVNWQVRGEPFVMHWAHRVTLDGHGLALDLAVGPPWWSGASPEVRECVRNGGLLLRSPAVTPATATMRCEVALFGLLPRDVPVRRWSLRDVIEGTAKPEVVDLEPAEAFRQVQLEVRYRDDQTVLPYALLLTTPQPKPLFAVSWIVGRITPGVGTIWVAPGRYRVRCSGFCRTFEQLELTVADDPAANRVTFDVERGGTLRLVPGPELGPGVALEVATEVDGRRQTSGITYHRDDAGSRWRDLRPGRYQLRYQGIGGRWREHSFELRVGQQYELTLAP